MSCKENKTTTSETSVENEMVPEHDTKAIHKYVKKLADQIEVELKARI